jgi:hypothetical protein
METSTSSYFSRQASLVLIGQWFQEQEIWPVIERLVTVKQKCYRYTPQEKLLDIFVTMLSGGRGVVESNLRLRPDIAVQRAFGRQGCAEQSTLSETLTACEAQTISAMRQALAEILHRLGACSRHDYEQAWQVLDVDLTGLGGGPQGEGVTRGYFAQSRRRRGRQLGRVLASQYAESVVEHLYEGRRQLEKSFQALLVESETTLKLTENQRLRTVVRVDGGAGSTANITWVLARGYGLIAKLHSAPRAAKLARSVTEWAPDAKSADRSLGWITTPIDYGHPTRQMALRYPKKDKHGQLTWHYHVVVCSVSDAVLSEMGRCPPNPNASPAEQLHLLSHVYDLRSGGLETQIRSDKQGLGLSKRTKRAFAAQEMLVLLTQLAHNVVIWTRNHLARQDARFLKFGVQRMIRDVFQIEGQVTLAQHAVQQVTLCTRHPYSAAVMAAFGPCTQYLVA